MYIAIKRGVIHMSNKYTVKPHHRRYGIFLGDRLIDTYATDESARRTAKTLNGEKLQDTMEQAFANIFDTLLKGK